MKIQHFLIQDTMLIISLLEMEHLKHTCFRHISAHFMQLQPVIFMHEIPVTILKGLLFHAWTMHDSWNMHVTGRDLGHFTGRYHACYKHELLPDISCMFHGWNLADFMHETCMFQAIFHVWYWCIPCLVLAYSMCGTGVFHAWYRRISCMVQAYSMHGTGIFHACVPCVVRVFPCMYHVQYRQLHHIISILIDFALGIPYLL